MTDEDWPGFLARERRRFIRYVRSLIRETAEMEAEDIVHDVTLKLLERADLLPPERLQPGYIYRALRNRVIDRRRTAKGHASLDAPLGEEGLTLADVLPGQEPDPLAWLQQAERRQALFAALGELGEAERAVIIGHEFEGLSFREMSEETGTPQNTLLARKRRGLMKLKDILSKQEGDRS